MRITSQTNYALRMLMYCASKGEVVTIREIAEFYHLSDKFLAKILMLLTKHGYVVTERGRKGGFRLARPAHTIRIGDVVENIEDNFQLAECFSSKGADCPLIESCGLRRALSRALQSFLAVLNEYSLDQFTDNKNAIRKLLQEAGE